MKTSKKSLLIVLFLGMALLLGIRQINSVNVSLPNKPQPSITPQVLDNGWYRFADIEAGYSLDYPPNYARVEYGKNKGEKYNHVFVEFFGREAYHSQSMIILIEPNPNKLSVEEFLTAWYSKQTKQTSQPSFSKAEMGEFFSVGTNPAIRTKLIVNAIPTSYLYHVIFVVGDKAFITGPAYGMMSASAVTPEAEKLFSQIFATFTFIP